MNLTEWRTAVKEQAGRLRSRLNNLVRHTEQLAPGVLYGATATLAVTPLVASRATGGGRAEAKGKRPAGCICRPQNGARSDPTVRASRSDWVRGGSR